MVQQYVIDTSILIQGFIVEPDTPRVKTLLHSALGLEPVHEINVPEFCILECGNILWKRVRLYGKPRSEAEQAIENLIRFPLIVHNVVDLLPRALELGLSHQLAIYDSLYIALAESLSCPLITIDQRQAQAATAAGVTLKPLTDFPEFKETE